MNILMMTNAYLPLVGGLELPLIWIVDSKYFPAILLHRSQAVRTILTGISQASSTDMPLKDPFMLTRARYLVAPRFINLMSTSGS